MHVVTHVAEVKITGEMSIMGDAHVGSWQPDLRNGSLVSVLSEFWELISQVRQWSNQQFDIQDLFQPKD